MSSGCAKPIDGKRELEILHFGTAFAVPADFIVDVGEGDASAVRERGHADDHGVQVAEIAGPRVVRVEGKGKKTLAGFHMRAGRHVDVVPRLLLVKAGPFREVVEFLVDFLEVPRVLELDDVTV